ncbi:MAG: hypothetical protein O3C21_20250, partial [Verrucomicrobia bacterium]|nr:hypothetical protein [Verrucomicrobiota bacterium]
MNISASQYFRSPLPAIPDAWCGSIVSYPSDKGIGEIFSEVAARYPDRVAVRFGEKILIYSDLQFESDAFAGG